jgi:predicted CXXCH cytochrome family protein
MLEIEARDERNKRRQEGSQGRGWKMRKIAIAFGILAIALIVGFLVTAGQDAPDASSELETTKNPGTYIGVDVCKTCHNDKYTDWQGTGHGEDFTNFDYHGSSINLITRYSPNASQYLPGSCAVCHTVGYNETTLGGFDPSEAYNSTHNIDFLGIQCENCHGPGSDHPGASDKAATIIGQPTNDQSCYGDTNSGCHGPTGHFNYWNESKHAVSLDAAGGMVASNEGCQQCHTREGYVNYMDGTTNPVSSPNPIDCAACHDPHDATNEYQLRATVDEICGTCHNNGYETTPSADPHIHHPQDEINDGMGGANLSMGSGMAGVECVDCHMWETPSVKRGLYLSEVIGGEEHKAHWFEPTAEACADCHSSIMPTMPGDDKPTTDIDEGEANHTLWMQWEIFETQWESEVEKWQKTIDGWQEDFETRWADANATLADAYSELMIANSSADTDQMALTYAWYLYYDALWNLHYVEADGSQGVHNFDYAMALLSEVEADSAEIVRLSQEKAAAPPDDGEEPTDYTTFFYVVIALLVVSMILSIMALLKKPKGPEPEPIPEEKPPEPLEPPEPKE